MDEKLQQLSEILRAINDKAVFYSNLIKTQKLSDKFDKLQDLYIQNKREGILYKAQDIMGAYERLACGHEIPLKSISTVIGCFDQYRSFGPFVALAGRDFHSDSDLLNYLLNFNFEEVDKKRALVYALPMIFLDKVATWLQANIEPEHQVHVFKLFLTGRYSEIQKD